MPVRYGERMTMERFDELDDDWRVFYSVGFLDRKGFDRQRELDFLLLHPTRGAVFVEVKGGRVQFENGRVQQWLDGDWKLIDPARQLNGARRVALEYMKSIHSTFIPARNLYVFPATQRPIDGLSQELAVASVFSDEFDELVETIGDWCPPTGDRLDVEALQLLLEPCLTQDNGESNAADMGVVPTAKSLTEIEQNQGTSFASLGEARAMLSEHSAALQEIWNEVAMGRSELEELGGGATVEGTDLLTSLLRETESLLAGERVEVGVFGQVKRGKSTLVNALVGREVSAVGMLPKTAVPVEVEWGEDESGWILQSDGQSSTVPVEDAIEATTQTERRRREEAHLPQIDRVSLRLPLDWLPLGVRLVDTPGLSDPSLTDDYENFARAELERVAAGVLVISYPPGPDEHESVLIRNLARYGIAKLFFVVNMWSDVWSDPGARAEITGYLTDMLRAANDEGAEIEETDLRVLPANLKAARNAQESGDIKALKESGLPAIKDLVESFLTQGALGRISVSASRRLLQVAQLIVSALESRVSTIRQPERVDKMRADLRASIEDAAAVVDSIMEEVELKSRVLSRELEAIAAEPYAWASDVLATESDRNALKNLESRLSIRSNTSASQLAVRMNKQMSSIVAEARTTLVDRLSVTSWMFAVEIDTDQLFAAESSESFIEEYRAPTDYRGVTRAGGSVIGAMLGGGGGIALAATGPIGLLIGGLLGYALGDMLGGSVSDAGNSNNASQREIASFRGAVKTAENQSRDAVKTAVADATRSIRASLDRQKSEILADARREVALIEKLLGDEQARSAALEQIDTALETVARIVG